MNVFEYTGLGLITILFVAFLIVAIRQIYIEVMAVVKDKELRDRIIAVLVTFVILLIFSYWVGRLVMLFVWFLGA